MKSAKFVIALTAAVLLPSLASARDVEDAVSVSFERDMNYMPSTQASPAGLAETDPLREALNAALARSAKTEARALPTMASQAGFGLDRASN
jgi:hypothetical protein